MLMIFPPVGISASATPSGGARAVGSRCQRTRRGSDESLLLTQFPMIANSYYISFSIQLSIIKVTLAMKLIRCQDEKMTR